MEKRSKVEIKPIQEAPNLQMLKDTFGISEEDTIIAYGDKIYCPPSGMSRDLLVHETTHCERQGFNERSAERWWEQYLKEPKFRLREEAIAYRQQYLYCCKVYKDRNRQAKILHSLAIEMASERYGKMITVLDAKLWINPPRKDMV